MTRRGDEPLRHIMRTDLPWRPATKTICGHPAAQYPPELVLSIREARALVRDLGQQRAAFVLCMTCANYTSRWAEWESSPIARMEREVVGGSFSPPDPQIESELRAIGILIDRHRSEFDELVTSFVNRDVVTMADLRKQRARRGQ